MRTKPTLTVVPGDPDGDQLDEHSLNLLIARLALRHALQRVEEAQQIGGTDDDELDHLLGEATFDLMVAWDEVDRIRETLVTPPG